MEPDSRFVDSYMAAMTEERSTKDRELWVEAQLTRSFMVKARVALVSTVMAFPVPVIMLYGHINPAWLAIWIVAIFAMTLMRYRVILTFLATNWQDNLSGMQNFISRYRWTWPANSIIWASLLFVYIGRVPSDNQYMSLLIIIGMGAFASGLLSARMDCFKPYVHGLAICCLLAIITAWVTVDNMRWNSSLLVLLVMNLLFWRLVLYTGERFHVMQRRGFELQFDNEQLIRSLREQTESAIEAARVKDRLLASAAHDLRQPVHALAFYADWLRNEPELSATVVPKILVATDSVNLLFNSLFDFARIEAGAIEPKLASLPISDLIDELVLQHTPEAHAKGLMLRSRVQEARVWSDSILLRRIIANLISNAIRYTDSGGVLVSTRIRGKGKQQRVWIEVWDTGPGIAPEHVGNIFREFYKASRHKGTEDGFGLGLAIVKRLCEALGHGITLRTRTDRGTRFRLSVALASTQDVQTPTPDITAAQALGAKRAVAQPSS
jgi:signal transduction histidine kinase